MRRSLILSICVVLCGALFAQADPIPINWVGFGSQAGENIAGLSYTRTVYNSSLDEIDIHLAGAAISPDSGVHSWNGGDGLQLLEGTFTAEGLSGPAGDIYIGGTSAFTYKASTSNNGFSSQPAPSSYIQFDTVTSGFPGWTPFTSTGAVYPSFAGSWYTNQSTGPDARLYPSEPPANVGAFDNTLLAKIFVTTNDGLNFAGTPGWGGWGFANSVNLHGNFAIPAGGGPTTPEPSTLLLAASGLIGLLCYAWRKRRS